MKGEPVTFKFTTWRIVLILAFIILIGLIIFVFLFPAYDINFSITGVMAYLTGSIAIVTLIYNAIAIESRQKFHQETLDVQKHRYTYDIVSKMNEPEMVRCLFTYSYIRSNKDEFFKDGTGAYFEDFINKKENKELKIHVTMLLNYFEHISLLVVNKHVEEKIVKDSFESFFTKGYSIMGPYISKSQSQTQTPKVWSNFAYLAQKWQKE